MSPMATYTCWFTTSDPAANLVGVIEDPNGKQIVNLTFNGGTSTQFNLDSGSYVYVFNLFGADISLSLTAQRAGAQPQGIVLTPTDFQTNGFACKAAFDLI